MYHTPEEREAAIKRKAAIAAEGGWKYEAAGVLVLDGTVGRCYNCGRVSTTSLPGPGVVDASSRPRLDTGEM